MDGFEVDRVFDLLAAAAAIASERDRRVRFERRADEIVRREPRTLAGA